MSELEETQIIVDLTPAPSFGPTTIFPNNVTGGTDDDTSTAGQKIIDYFVSNYFNAINSDINTIDTAIQTPATGQLFAANSGQLDAAGTITYQLQFPSDALSLTPPIVPDVTNPWVVNAAPGYYSDPGAPGAVVPYLSYRGDPVSPPSLELISSGSFTLGDWSGGGAATIENFNLVNGGIDLDFFSSSYSGTINLKNITTGSSGIVRVFGTDSSVTFVNVDNLKTTVVDPTFDGVNLSLKNSKLTGVIISANQANSVAVIDSLETTVDGIYLQATLAMVDAQITNSPKNASLVLDGTAITVSIDAISLTAVGGLDGITYADGATSSQVTLLDNANSIGVTFTASNYPVAAPTVEENLLGINQALGSTHLGESWIFVDGSDTTGAGSLINPWALVTHANAVINPLLPYEFRLGAGTYYEGVGGDIPITVNKSIVGSGVSNTRVNIQPGVSNWSLDAASWAGVNGTIEFNNFQTDSSIGWDFAGAGATGSTSYIVNFKTNLGINVIGTDKDTDAHYSNDSFLNGNSYFQNLTAYWNNVQAQGQMYMNAFGGNVYARVTSCNFPAAGNTLVASVGDSLYARFETTILPFLTINGQDVSLDIDVSTYRDCTVSFANSADHTQVNVLTGSVVKWNIVTGTSQQMVPWNAYTANNAGLVTLTLPVSAMAGTEIEVSGLGAGGWRIAQNASQVINNGSSATTTGVGGSLSSTNRYDSVTLRCVVNSTTWVVTSRIGTLTVV